MRRVAVLSIVVVLAGAAAACDGFTLFVSAGPLPDRKPSPTEPPPTRSISLGEVVHSTFVVPEVRFDLRAPRSGTLFIRLSWDRHDGHIRVAFASTVLASTIDSSSDGASVVTLRVSGGERYQISVVGEQGPIPFSLTTAIE